MTPDLDAFRAEVRAFLDAELTDEMREAAVKSTSVFTPFAPCMAWQQALAAKGWAAPRWPVEAGGCDWTDAQHDVFEEELQAAGAPALLPHNLKMIGPLLLDLGTPEQKAKYLPGIYSGTDFWCQGYSEPGAGSDLASLKCAAVANGDDYVLNGSKTWTTYAHHANRMFLLVRTRFEGKPQQGITFLLIDDMKTPGIEVRPIIALDGFPEQCEVFFTDARVPRANIVGAEHDGWTVAKHLLKYERGGGAPAPGLRRKLIQVQIAAAARDDGFGRKMSDDPAFQERLGQLAAEVESLDHLFRVCSPRGGGEMDPAYPSMMKTLSADLGQAIAALMIEVAGTEGLPRQLEALEVGSDVDPLSSEFDMLAMPYWLNARATTIYAGSNEIQRDLIARRVLG